MLAYAAENPRPAGRAGSPKALTLIIAGHAVLIAAVMAAKMELIPPIIDEPPIIYNVPQPAPPVPEPQPRPQTDPRPQTQAPTHDPLIDRTPPIVDMGQTTSTEIATGLTLPPPGGDLVMPDPPRHVPVKLGPRFATNESMIKPPYPLDRIRDNAEATLKLRLTIDARGRVTAVDPVGFADPSFLEAARRHIIRAWRYKPATEDGVGVPSSTVISLSFRMEDV